jgi:hypothetical protein
MTENDDLEKLFLHVASQEGNIDRVAALLAERP